MSVFLSPDMKPFYGGTYWPPVSRMGMPGFADVLTRVAEAWRSQRDKLMAGADELTEAGAETVINRWNSFLQVLLALTEWQDA